MANDGVSFSAVVLTYFTLFFCGCIHPYETECVPQKMYEAVAQSFLMLAREDEKDGKSVWSQGIGVAEISTWV